MDVLRFAVLVVTGFTACAEFGSYALVHPVVRRLPPRHHLAVEQGLLGTFGRVMPVLMAASVVLTLLAAVAAGSGGAAVSSWLAAGAVVAALGITLRVNVPINVATSRWDVDHPPADWRATRERWERFQGVRSWLLLLGFVLVCLAVAT